MTDKEKIRAEVYRRFIEAGKHIGVIAETREDELSSLLSFIDSMQEEPVSDDLKKAHWNAAIKYDSKTPFGEYLFRAGVNWKREQMMKDAVDAFIYKGSIRLKEWPLPEKYGKHLDPVKVIILNKK